MHRRYGNPGRLDLTGLEPPPAEPFLAGRAAVLAGAVAVAVYLLGFAMLVLAGGAIVLHLLGR